MAYERKGKMKFREKTLESGTKIILGKNAESNEKLVKEFKRKPNLILHTVTPGSPFCVIEKTLKPSNEDINTSGAICARYSRDWRDNKKDVKVNIFTGKDVYKLKSMPIGTFGVKKSRTMVVKKEEIQKFK